MKASLDAYPEQTLADAGYRSEAVLDELADKTDLYVALGREGKEHVAINAANLPRTAAMADKSHPTDGSRASWASANSACAACIEFRPSGSSCAWP